MAPGGITIRGAQAGDAPGVHAILTSPHVLRGSMRVPHSRLERTAERLVARDGLHQLVAEADGSVVGFAELVTEPAESRGIHAGEINLVATHADWTRRGIGRALTEALLDLADNWLRLERVGLIVFDGTDHAVALYEGLGFEREGTMRRFAFGDGGWMDAIVMGRLRSG